MSATYNTSPGESAGRTAVTFTLISPGNVAISPPGNYQNAAQGSTVVLNATGGTGYAWTNDNGDNLGNASSISVTKGGNYFLSGYESTCNNFQTTAPTYVNYQPSSDAGLDQSISTLSSYLIYGSGSDPEGKSLTFAWSKQSGPTVTMSGTTTPTLLLIGPPSGSYVFRLTATDPYGSSVYDDMSLAVGSVSNNYNYVENDMVNIPGKTSVGAVASTSTDYKNVTISYSDALGRGSQTVQMKASPLKKDILQPNEYDPLGRAKKSFLPIATSSVDGSFHANETGTVSGNAIVNYTSSEHYVFYNSTGVNVPQDTKPYSDQTFFDDPVGRVKQSGSAGAAFQPGVANGFKSATYGTNASSGAYAVRLWTAPGAVLPASTGLFTANTLKAVTSTDEQGAVTITFTNREGMKLCTKVATTSSSSGYAETYYVYDAFNRLRYILPPEFIKISAYATGTTTPTVSKTDVNAWTYQFIYDNLGRVIKSKVPGAGWVYSVYDNRDRVVLTQDSVQRANNQWNYTKYDALNRAVVSGIYSPGSAITLATMQATVSNLASGAGYQNVGAVVSSSVGTGTDIVLTSYSSIDVYVAGNSVTLDPGFDFIGGTTSTSFTASIGGASVESDAPAVFPTTGIENLVFTYFDDYARCEVCSDANYQFTSETFNSSSNDGAAFSKATAILGNVVGSKVKILGTSTWLPTVTYYNWQGKSIQTIGGNHLGGRDRVSSLFDFSGKKLEELQTAISYSNGGINTLRKVFTYDPMGRVLVVQHQINTQPIIQLASYQYNELGQVIRKNLHSADGGSTFLQSVDYRTNIRGWLTNINNLSGGDDTNDYFGLDLTYNGTISSAGNTARTDGLISAVTWKQDLTAKKSLYNFVYDDMKRLSSSTFKMNNSGASPPVTNWSLQNNFYNEDNITYDLNGNIKSLNRKLENFNGTANAADAIDQLTYDYSSYGGNQLGKVTEGSTSSNKALGFKDGTNPGSDYAYDGNGNVGQDLNKSISSITYYFNNLPKRITFSDNTYLENTYDAAGIKLYHKFYNASGVLQTTTDYIGSFVLLNGQVLSVKHQEGRITAPTYSNLMDNKEAGSKDGFTALGTVTLGTAYVSTQTYVTASCGQAGGTAGIFPIRTTKGDTYTGVKAGETYSFKVLGYQSSGTTASLYVKTNLGDLIWPGATLPVGSANENWVTASITIPSGATSIQVGIKWSTPANTDVVYINRVALYKTDFEYNYFINDQVGSTRVVLQTNPATITYTATMETENQSTESTQFMNMNTSYIVTSTGNTTPGGNEVIKLNSTNRVGPGKSIKVYPGDVINASAYSYYIASGTYSAGAGSTVGAAVASAFGGVSSAVGDPGLIYQSVTSAYTGGLSGLAVDRGNTSYPSAYLNYILFDKDYKPISGQSVPISTTSGSSQPLSLSPITAQEIGYVYIYLSYDNASGGDVFFDDLKITVTESPVIQVNNYYPFGMISYAWLRPGETDNAFLFQGKELIAQTGWHDFGSRMYWADLGRWFGTDPQNQFNSPYTAMGNMPMMGTDPNGEWFVIDDLVVSLVAGISNVISNWDHITEHGFDLGKFGQYFGAGAVGGEVGLYAGPEAGFLAGGYLNFLADRANGYVTGDWDWKSVVNGGLSTLGSAEVGLDAAEKAGYKELEKSTFEIAENRTKGLLEKISFTNKIFNAELAAGSGKLKIGEYLHDGLRAGRDATLDAYVESDGKLDFGEAVGKFANGFGSNAMAKFSTREITNKQLQTVLQSYTQNHLSNIIGGQTALNDFYKEMGLSLVSYTGRLFAINSIPQSWNNNSSWFSECLFVDPKKH